jgi:hypothetical protein
MRAMLCLSLTRKLIQRGTTMTANITSHFVSAAAAVTILCMASGLLVARVAQTGFANAAQFTPKSDHVSVFFDHEGTPLTGRRAWNAARAMGGPNWRP